MPACVQALHAAGVTLHGGPRGVRELGLAPAPAEHHEYGTLDVTVELVDGLAQAIQHVHAHGSGHTECIITGAGVS